MARKPKEPKKPKQITVVEAPVVEINVRGLRASARGVSITYEGSPEGALDVLKALNAMLAGGER